MLAARLTQRLSHRQLSNSAYGLSSHIHRCNMGTLSDIIVHDHVELDRYYNNILNSKDNDSKTRWQNQFTWELARHSIGEELVVYRAVEKSLPDGKEMAEKDRAEHRKVGTSNSPPCRHWLDKSADKGGRLKNSSTSSKTLSPPTLPSSLRSSL